MRAFPLATLALLFIAPMGFGMGAAPRALEGAGLVTDGCGSAAMNVVGQEGWEFRVVIASPCAGGTVVNESFGGFWKGYDGRTCLTNGNATFCLAGNSVSTGVGATSWQASYTNPTYHAAGTLKGRVISSNTP